MNAELVVFIVFGVVSVAGAFTMVAARNPVYSALGLLSTMFSMAVFYVMNDAHFVAAVQVLIYAGAVMTLFLFVIMLIGVDTSEDRKEQLPFQRPIGLVLGAGLAILLVVAMQAAWVTGLGLTADDGDLIVPVAAEDRANVPEVARRIDVTTGSWTPADDAGVGTIEDISDELFGTWLLPFEATVLLLTIAAVGTVALARFSARPRNRRSRSQDLGTGEEPENPVEDPESNIQDPGSRAERSEA